MIVFLSRLIGFSLMFGRFGVGFGLVIMIGFVFDWGFVWFV